MYKKILSLGAILMMAGSLYGKVSLPPYFSDNMIVQQNATLTVVGTSEAKGKVQVKASWNNRTVEGKIDANGKFSVSLPTPKAGGPYTITVSDGDAVTFQNVLAGEVWFCSGQSNMEMPMKGWGKVKDFEKEIANAKYPKIRLLQSKRVTASLPTDDLQLNDLDGKGWAECSPKSVENFSSTAYFFGRYLWNKLNVPIGLIDSSWGGTPAEAWTSIGTLKNVVDLEEFAAEVEAAEGKKEALEAKHKKDMAAWQIAYDEADQGMENGKPRWTSALQVGEGWNSMELPSPWEWRGLDNFDGIVWFQKAVEIPADWAGKELTLKVGKVDDLDVTYFNGVKVGSTDGYWIERSYKVPAKAVKKGLAIITVQVKDGSGLGGICGDASGLALCCGDQTISLAGNWNYHVGVAHTDLPKRPENPSSQNYTANLYNAMVYPYRNFPIKGAIWYQGEANVEQWQQYTPLFQGMIQDWRKLWNNNLPFYFVQIANFMQEYKVQPESTWAHLREAQANALHLENTGMAVTIDIGEAYDIHPKNKQEVGARLGRAALAQTYGIGKYELAKMTDFNVADGKLTVTFNQPVHCKGKKVEGFAIAGTDMKFYPAEAKIVDGKKVVVSSDKVKMPIAVRYAWADNPPCNLYSNGDLPVGPFRTDGYK